MILKIHFQHYIIQYSDRIPKLKFENISNTYVQIKIKPNMHSILGYCDNIAFELMQKDKAALSLKPIMSFLNFNAIRYISVSSTTSL